MKLAEEILITLAGETVELRPSLRHALRLERREGGFRQLLIDLGEQSLSASVEIVEPHYDGDLVEHRVFDALPAILPALTAYVLACAGIDAGKVRAERGEGDAKRETQPFGDHLAALYKFGTGWMGWTPEETLDATPAEITLAYEGHLDMLRAIHGGGEKSSKPKAADSRPIADKFRAAFSAIGTTKAES
ncbi:hypothetical protein [Shinella zoogloeoides]|uniref:hypothetical protein n=1 Tax=Shinella zoogloeoides TaxID=352475 RepID=UPI001F5739C9|nr:hypothetical protein [Shinella zoogloeoides]